MASSGDKRRRQIKDFITEHTEKHGFSPTVREIGEAVGLKSSSTVHGHIQEMKARGDLDGKDKLTRTLRVVGAGEESAEAFNRHLRGLVASLNGVDFWTQMSERERLILADLIRSNIRGWGTVDTKDYDKAA